MTTLLEVKELRKTFPASGRGSVQMSAVKSIDLNVDRGEIVGLVGESGSGKTTTARCIARLITPTGGSVRVENHDVLTARGRELKELRRRMKMVFQNPYSSLDPRMRIGAIIGEGLAIHRIGASSAERRSRVSDMLMDVGLTPSTLERYPRELSGGQRQRVAIARALALRPKLLICDEVVSGLDVSIQAQVGNLLADLRDKYELGILFIAHDLAIVRQLCDRVYVMRDGSIVESASATQLFTAPKHAYTMSLLRATPTPDPRRPFMELDSGLDGR